jgi:alpha-L-fucosidase
LSHDPTVEDVIAAGPYDATWEALGQYTVPSWYEDGKFGIFIHWGPYAVPAFENEWYPRNMYLVDSNAYKHHVETYGPQTTFGYKDFIPQLTASEFDPDAWASLFQEAGARYVVPVAEHHDGFAMYDCSFTRWSSVRMGPQRDVLGELAAAVRRRGLVFGASYHRAEHWWFFNGGRDIESDATDPRYDDLYGPAQPRPETNRPDKAFLDDWMARLVELVDRYQPQLVYFDWWIEQPAFRSYLSRFAAYYYNRSAQWNRGAVINYKHGELKGESAFAEGSAVYDIERGQMRTTSSRFWQSDASIMRNSWCHVSSADYKPVNELIGDLVDVVSKNGALLLNVGPRADGSIPDAAAERLRAVGRWLEVNGEAIYASRPWRVFGEGPTESAPVIHGVYADVNGREFTERDIRFTTRGTTLYATFLAWPESGTVTITSLGEHGDRHQVPIAHVELLGSGVPLAWERDGDALRVALPARAPRQHPGVLRITGE